MTHKNYINLLGVFIFSLLMFSSCSSDDDNVSPPPTNTDFTDKWWYDSNNFTADLYFNSNGSFEQFSDFGGLNSTSTGDWNWENESEGLIKITNYMGGGQTLPEVYLRLTDVESTSMTVQQSADGVNFSFEVFYVDVEPADN